ncbi:MAG: hypothetical protein ACJ71Y_10325 [Blastococcus sp.]
MTEDQPDVVDLLSADHREFDRIFTELECLRGRSEDDAVERKRRLVDEVTIGLVKHSVAEETMKRLERMDADDPAFDAAVAELIREIRHHVEDEEGVIFTQLRASFSHDELVDMGGLVETVKKLAPTRAHPMTPNEAGVRLAVGPVASPLDHLRDTVSGRGKQAD